MANQPYNKPLDKMFKFYLHRLQKNTEEKTGVYTLGLSIENDIVFNKNATIVLHMQIVFVSFSHGSLWRPFSKVIVFSRFCVDAR